MDFQNTREGNVAMLDVIIRSGNGNLRPQLSTSGSGCAHGKLFNSENEET